MTKATCSCGATLETDSAEMLSQWSRDHAMHASPLPQFVPMPVYPQTEPQPWWREWEITCREPPNFPEPSHPDCGPWRLPLGMLTTTSGC